MVIYFISTQLPHTWKQDNKETTHDVLLQACMKSDNENGAERIVEILNGEAISLSSYLCT